MSLNISGQSYDCKYNICLFRKASFCKTIYYYLILKHKINIFFNITYIYIETGIFDF